MGHGDRRRARCEGISYSAAAAFDIVAVVSPDRLARKYADQVLLLKEFRRLGCAVAFLHRPITDDPHDQLLLQIQGAVAEYERYAACTIMPSRARNVGKDGLSWLVESA